MVVVWMVVLVVVGGILQSSRYTHTKEDNGSTVRATHTNEKKEKGRPARTHTISRHTHTHTSHTFVIIFSLVVLNHQNNVHVFSILSVNTDTLFDTCLVQHLVNE